MTPLRSFSYIKLVSFLLVIASCSSSPKTADIKIESAVRKPSGYTIPAYPILERLENSGRQLSPETKKWMRRWKDLDLEQTDQYVFDELSGSTSINLKIKKKDPSSEKGYKAYGSFVPRNGAANFNVEIAYFNLAAILGFDHIFRPAVRYELGSHTKAIFKDLILKTSIKGENRLINKNTILTNIASNEPLLGCLKAKKPEFEISYNDIVNPSAPPNGAPKTSNPIIAFLQAQNPKPVPGKKITLLKSKGEAYIGDEAELTREYSIIMIFDALFQQWDRYSMDNVVIYKNEEGIAHFYFTDNGGADITKTTGWVERNLGWFSRYHRPTIETLRQLNQFLNKPESGFLGYTNAEEFIVDLGLYSELNPAIYVDRIKRNLQLLLGRVDQNYQKYQEAIYLD